MKIRFHLLRQGVLARAAIVSALTLLTASSVLSQIIDPRFENPGTNGWQKIPNPPPDGAVGPRVEKQANGNHVGVIGGDGATPGADGASIRQTFNCDNSEVSNCVIRFEYGYSVPDEVVERAYIRVSNPQTTVTKTMKPGPMGPHSISIKGCSPETTIQFWIENDAKDAAGTQSQLTLDNFSNACLRSEANDSSLTDPPDAHTPPDDEWGPLVESPAGGGNDSVAIVPLFPGVSLIANNFSRGGNTLDEVLPQVPPNSMLFKLNPTNSYYDSYLRMPEGWQPPGGTLLPGEAAFLRVAETQTVVFSGEVVLTNSRPRPAPGSYLYGALASIPMSLEAAVGFPLIEGDRISLFGMPSFAMPAEPSLVVEWPSADPSLLPLLLPGNGLMIDVAEELVPPPPPPPFPLSVQMEGELLHFSWPMTEEPLQLLATESITEPVWQSLNVPTTVAEGLVHAYVSPGSFTGPVCIAVGKPDCACKDLKLKSIGFSEKGATYKGVNGGKTEVTLAFGVKGVLTCDKDWKKGVCRGKISWALTGPSNWGQGVQSTDTSKSGSKIVTAKCDGKAHDVTAEPFTFETVVTAGRPVRGTAEIKITTECPIGTVKDTRTISVVFDSNSADTPKGVDRGASDLDGDGLTGTEEATKGTKDDQYDTDGDGTNDKDDDVIDPP